MKKNKIRKFNGDDGSLVKKIVPAQVRTFVSTLAGNKDPITEKDFTADELKQARDAVVKSRERQTGKRFIKEEGDKLARQHYDQTVDYKDYGKGMNSGRQDLNVGSDAAIRNTLGKFSYEKTPEGRLIAKDKYDFKDDLVKESKVRPSAEYEKMSTLGKIGTIAADTIVHPRGFTTLPSRIGSAFIGKDGRPVKIDLGEAPVKKGGKVEKPKQSSASRRGDGAAKRGKTRGKIV